MVPLVQDLKRWAVANGLHNASAGHLSSYSLTLLGIFYCQVLRGEAPVLSAEASALNAQYWDCTVQEAWRSSGCFA